MVTVNAAAALSQHDTLGKIRVGCLADLIAVPWHGRASAIFEEGLAHREKIPWMMLDGAVQGALAGFSFLLCFSQF